MDSRSLIVSIRLRNILENAKKNNIFYNWDQSTAASHEQNATGTLSNYQPFIFFTTLDNLIVTGNYYNTDKKSHFREKASIVFAWKTNRALQRNVAKCRCWCADVHIYHP